MNIWIHLQALESAIQSLSDPADRNPESAHLATLLDGGWARAEDMTKVMDRYIHHASGQREVLEANRKNVGLVGKALKHHFAASTVQALLDAGADPNIPARSGRWEQTTHYPINQAINYPEMMRLLLASGADVSLRNHECLSPLGYALEQARWSSVEKCELVDDPVLQLLQAGADPNASLKQFRGMGSGVDFLESRKGIHTQWLFEHGADLSLRSLDGRTALHCPLNAEAARIALAAGLDPAARDANGNTPLHCQTSADGVAALVAAGANPNAINAKGVTPLAAVHTEEARAALLAAGARPNPNATAGKLYLAVSSGSVARVKKCLDAGADPNDFFDEDPVLFAAVRGPDKFNPKVIEMLLDAGANPTAGKGYMGGFLGFLALNEHVSVPGLIARVAPLCDLHQQDEYGMTILGRVAFNMNTRGRDKSKPDPRVVMCQALIDAGARPSEADFKSAPNLALRTLFKRATSTSPSAPRPDTPSVGMMSP